MGFSGSLLSVSLQCVNGLVEVCVYVASLGSFISEIPSLTYWEERATISSDKNSNLLWACKQEQCGCLRNIFSLKELEALKALSYFWHTFGISLNFHCLYILFSFPSKTFLFWSKDLHVLLKSLSQTVFFLFISFHPHTYTLTGEHLPPLTCSSAP